MGFTIDMPNYLSKHDVVHLSPPREGWEGLPIGNGSFGGPMWAGEEGFIFQANHTDTYELPHPHDFLEQLSNWMVLRSCGQLKMQHSVPAFNWLYLNDFEGRLSMHPAQAKMVAKTAFGEFETTAYVHACRPVAVFHHRAAYCGDLEKKGAPIRLVLERWGSRVMGWWYSEIQGGAHFGLGTTRAFIEDNDACLETTFRGVSVMLRCRVVGANSTLRVNHDHQVEIVIDAAAKQDLTIYLACVTSHDDADPVSVSKKAIDDAISAGELEKEHRQWWAEYWKRSFLHISQDYFENLYYLYLYLMGSSSRGKFPPLFNGALWLWNHDVRNWVNPHHWNEQQLFWGLPAANRVDLLSPYLNTYHRLMPRAIEATARRGFQGMLWVDQHDYSGRQVAEDAPSFRDNYTPAAQIAMFFWWHYLFTGDVNHLREKGYPFMKAVGDFYLGWLRWSADRNQYDVPLASTYEDERPWRFTDSITNLAMIRAIFPALIQAGERLENNEEYNSRLQHVLDHLPPYRTNDRDKKRGVTLASGLVDGKEPPEKENHCHGPLFCPVFPTGDIGLKDKGTPLFEAACHTLATYPPVCVSITPGVIVAARLGMSEEALRRMTTIVRNIQHFPPGLMFNLPHWHIYSRRHRAMELSQWFDSAYWADREYQVDDSATYQRDYLEDRGCRHTNVRVLGSSEDGVSEHRVNTPMTPFIQPGMETMGHYAAGLQEMLLQSYDGVIRVFPAIPQEWEGCFTLLATGGFLVSSRREAHGEPEFIEIFSQRGGRCCVFIPWQKEIDVSEEGRKISVNRSAECIHFDTVADHRYVIAPAGQVLSESHYTGVRNTVPKTFQEASIGKARDF